MGIKTWDYIIVGQGLAGSVLAFTLIKANKTVLVINDENRQPASFASAGIFNPITGKRMSKTWNADKLFPYLLPFYKELENYLQVSIITEMAIYKPFSSVSEQNEWLTKSNTAPYSAFVNTNINKGLYKDAVEDELGGFETKLSGVIKVDVLIKALREVLIRTNGYLNSFVDLENLEIGDEEVSIAGQKAKKVIFCEGSYGVQNPYFSWIPFNPLKGQVVEIEIEKGNLDRIINKSAFVVPWDKIAKIGSTYERKFENGDPTEEGQVQILEKLNKFFKLKYKVVGQKAGIRPAIIDRRPVIGMHPRFQSLGVFNGLGTKGISIAPFYANAFLNYLEWGKPLDEDVSISRFYSIYI